MAKYPKDPNYLFNRIVDVNTCVAELVEEGWKVELGLAENGSRIYVKVSATRACDPPVPEGASA